MRLNELIMRFTYIDIKGRKISFHLKHGLYHCVHL